MWACETLGGARDSSAKQNWNLQKVPKAATEEPAYSPSPHPTPPVSWMHSPLRWGSRPRSRTLPGEVVVEQTDYWLTEARLVWEDVNQDLQTELERVRRRREDISVGWLKLSMSCFASYLPSPVLSLPLSATFPTHGRAPPIRLRCQSEAGLSHLFCLLSCISVWLNLALVWLKSTTLGNFILFALFSLS